MREAFETFRVANRPASGGFSTLVFFGLLPGDLNVEARAFPAADAQGVALASTSVKVTVISGNQTNLQVALASTVDRVEVSPASASIRPGSAQTLSGHGERCQWQPGAADHGPRPAGHPAMLPSRR